MTAIEMKGDEGERLEVSITKRAYISFSSTDRFVAEISIIFYENTVCSGHKICEADKIETYCPEDLENAIKERQKMLNEQIDKILSYASKLRNEGYKVYITP